MHAKQRILICRLGFIALGVLPTLLVSGWLASLAVGGLTGGTLHDWEVELSRRCGLDLEIAVVSYPLPGVARLEQVQWRDPETGEAIAQAAAIEVTAAADGPRLKINQLVVEAEQAATIRSVLEHRLFRSPESSESSVMLSATDIVIRTSSTSQTFRDVQGTLSADARAVELKLQATLPEAGPNTSPVTMVLRRDRTRSPPVTVWQLDTQGQWLPCSLVVSFAPHIDRLGRDCRFAGTIRGAHATAGPAATLQGKFASLDLDALVTEQFIHQLSGLADAEIASASISEGKLVELSGTLRARNGAISPSLLAAAQENLELELLIDPPSADSGQTMAFSELAFAFQIDGRSLRLGSIDQSGILLAGGSGPILAAPPNHATAAVNLLRALLPDNQYQVPATRQTDALVGLLPVPELAPTRTAALPGHTPTRLRPSGPAEAAPVLHEPGLR